MLPLGNLLQINCSENELEETRKHHFSLLLKNNKPKGFTAQWIK